MLTVNIGPGVVQRLLPQRPPFLMIDCIEGVDLGSRPMVRASRYLSANEPVFQGHFPDLPLFPGALLVEGAGQTASLVYTLGAILEGYQERGLGLPDLMGDLENLNRGLSLQPGFVPMDDSPLNDAFGHLKGLPVGVAGAVRFKFLKPVTPGCKLVYEATLTQQLGPQLHFAVDVLANKQRVAKGTLSAAVVEGMALPGASR